MDPLSDLRVQLWPNLQKGYFGECKRCLRLIVWGEGPPRRLCKTCQDEDTVIEAILSGDLTFPDEPESPQP